MLSWFPLNCVLPYWNTFDFRILTLTAPCRGKMIMSYLGKVEMSY